LPFLVIHAYNLYLFRPKLIVDSYTYSQYGRYKTQTGICRLESEDWNLKTGI